MYKNMIRTLGLFIAILAAILSSFAFAFESQFHLSTDLGLEGQSFDLASHNFPSVNYNGNHYTVQLIQDTNYQATLDLTGSTYTPVSKLASDAARLRLAAGFDVNTGNLLTWRFDLFSSLGNRSLANKQYYMYAPGISPSMVTPSGVTLPSVLPNSTEMVQLTQGRNYGLFISALYRLSDRHSIGPSYALSRSKIDSSEYLQYDPSSSASALPYYNGSFTLNNQLLGAMWLYKISPQTGMHVRFESSKQYDIAKKEIYFTRSGDVITGRSLPLSSSVSSSNWNGISCDKDHNCVCEAGADCSLDASKSYETAPYISLSRILTRISVGFDFAMGGTV